MSQGRPGRCTGMMAATAARTLQPCAPAPPPADGSCRCSSWPVDVHKHRICSEIPHDLGRGGEREGSGENHAARGHCQRLQGEVKARGGGIERKACFAPTGRANSSSNFAATSPCREPAGPQNGKNGFFLFPSDEGRENGTRADGLSLTGPLELGSSMRRPIPGITSSSTSRSARLLRKSWGALSFAEADGPQTVENRDDPSVYQRFPLSLRILGCSVGSGVSVSA